MSYAADDFDVIGRRLEELRSGEVAEVGTRVDVEWRKTADTVWLYFPLSDAAKHVFIANLIPDYTGGYPVPHSPEELIRLSHLGMQNFVFRERV